MRSPRDPARVAPLRWFALLCLAPLAGLACGGGGSSGPPPAAAQDAGPEVSIDDYVRALPASCAFECVKGCPEEATGPFVCPAMDAWSALPHDIACGDAPPAPKAAIDEGLPHCAASAPTGEALRRAGPIADRPGVFVLPDGHRISPSGREAILSDDTHVGGFSAALALVASTRYAIAVDAGFGDHLVRAIDLVALSSGVGAAVVSTVVLPRASWGVAVRDLGGGKHRAWVSGGATGKVFALAIDDATGALTLDDAHAIDLGVTSDGKPFFAAGLAATPDGARLVIAGSLGSRARIVSIADATYGKAIATVTVGGTEQFGVAIDPADSTGAIAWITQWDGARIVGVDTTSGAVKQSIPVGKDPEGVAFLDARWMVVAAADGDSLTLVDRVAGGAVSTVPIQKDAHGFAPTALAYDPSSKRLYVAEAVIDAVEVFDVSLSAAAPTLTSRGRIPTSWWPTDLAIDPSGKTAGQLLVLDGRGHGTGTGRTGKPFTAGYGEIAESMHGSVQAIDLASLDLAASTKEVASNLALSDAPGYPTVTCPAGVDDFPVPSTNTQGASKKIGHIVLVVRENKNFDGTLGDLGKPGDPVGIDGRADLVLAPGKMDQLWTNFRAMGKRWTIADNYYTDAEYSSQGHVWATYGRTTDFTERVWSIGASGKGRELGGGVTDVGRAEEGSIFEWLLRNHEAFDILGEATGAPAPPKDAPNPLDQAYPGVFQNIGLEDVTKSCYFAARARVRCDLHPFVYITLPNDHTFGGGVGRPTPETMIAVNDEATGVLLDALSHSPFWNDALVIVTEDDPQDGADHVDLHRTPIAFAGPFVKRGYVAKGHYDVASLIKLLANLRGLPYPNEVVARAPLPLEMFTAAADYAPFVATPRSWPRGCNAPGTRFGAEAAFWDFRELDEQPGLGMQVREMLRASPEARGPILPIAASAPPTPFEGPDD